MGNLLARRIWVCEVPSCAGLPGGPEPFQCKTVEEMFEHLQKVHGLESKLWGHEQIHSRKGDD